MKIEQINLSQSTLTKPTFKNVILHEPKTKYKSNILGNIVDFLTPVSKDPKVEEVLKKSDELITQIEITTARLDAETQEMLQQIEILNRDIEILKEQQRQEELRIAEKRRLREERIQRIKQVFSNTKEWIEDTTYDIGYKTKQITTSVKEWTGDLFFNIGYTIENIKDNFTRKIDNYKLKREKLRIKKEMELKVAQELELIKLRDKYKTLLISYQALTGNNNYDLNWSFYSLEELKEATKTITSEIEHETLVRNLEKKFSKGKKYYLPHQPLDPFNPKKLKEIIPNNNYSSYPKELARICNLYFDNTTIVDDSAKGCLFLSKKFFQTAAQSVKEIFDLGSDTKLLERIPKLGIIPKALRIYDQTKLVNCVKNDFKEVNNSYIKDGFVPILNKYNDQYKVITNFIKQNSKNSKNYQELTDIYLQKLAEARNSRNLVSAKLLKSYAHAGNKLCNMCNNIQINNAKDLARKTIMTFASFL